MVDRVPRLIAAALVASIALATAGGISRAAPSPAVLSYTGAMQSYAVPPGICSLTIAARGGQGVGGGNGALITSTVPVADADTLSVLVAGAGSSLAGGYGGGGGGSLTSAGGGGGASVVATSAGQPLVVAGGGGGEGGGAGAAVGVDATPSGVGGKANGNGGGGENGENIAAAGGAGGGVGNGGTGGTGTDMSNTTSEGGNGGGGDATHTLGGGGGGGGGTTSGIGGHAGGAGAGVGGLGGDTEGSGGDGNGTGGNGGGGGGHEGGGGAGGIGFSGGGGGTHGGGGGGGGYGGGGGGSSPASPSPARVAGGGSSFVTAGATGTTSSTGTGNGVVTIGYDPAVDACSDTPSAPTGVTQTAGVGSAAVTFTTPASDGGHPISSYRVTAADSTDPARGGQTATGTGSPITVNGLDSGDSYTFTVVATNSSGPGLASAASPAVSIPAPPGAATGVTATAGVGAAMVGFTAPAADGGSSITGYVVTATDQTNPANGGQGGAGPASPISVGGLTPGDSYTFTVTALTAVATGPASAPSNAVTPSAAATPTPQPPAIMFKSRAVARFVAGKRGRFRVRATGLPRIVYAEVGTLPKGVTFRRNGLLSGTARRAHRYTVAVIAVSGTSTAIQRLTLRITRPPNSTAHARAVLAPALTDTGALQSYTVPHGICTLTITTQGGQGAGGHVNFVGTKPGADAASITATVPVANSDTLSVLVAGAASAQQGGFGGGGNGAFGGGGASVVASSTGQPLIVAGGGGGFGGSAGGAANTTVADTSSYAAGGTADGHGGLGAQSGSDTIYAGGGGGGVNGGASGGGSSNPSGPESAQAGGGGGGTGTIGGGGGSRATYTTGDGTGGGSAGAPNQSGLPNGDATGGNGGDGAGGAGGIGFGGGGQGGLGGGGGGYGGGGGGGGVAPGGGGGSSYVVPSASGVTSSTGSGNGSVTIDYDPAADRCTGTPAEPTGVSATPGLAMASVAFTAPSSDGGHPISTYNVVATDSTDPAHGAQSATGTASPITVIGLYPDDSYTFTVTATNSVGPGLTSAPSAAVSTMVPPASPTALQATAQRGAATVSFAGAAGVVSGYVVFATDKTSASRGGQAAAGSASPITVSGLSAGDSYTFVVRAINAAGFGAPSAPSNAVTPTVALPPPVTPAIAFTSRAHVTFRVKQRGRFRAQASRATAYAEIGALPKGVIFTKTGVLSGTPRGRGTYPLTLVALAGPDAAVQRFTLTVLGRRR